MCPELTVRESTELERNRRTGRARERMELGPMGLEPTGQGSMALLALRIQGRLRVARALGRIRRGRLPIRRMEPEGRWDRTGALVWRTRLRIHRERMRRRWAKWARQIRRIPGPGREMG